MHIIFTFHSIDNSDSILSFPVEGFYRLMTAIANSGLPVLKLDQIFSEPEGVVVTFDDGMQSVKQNALPVLRDLNFTAHLFLSTGAVDSYNNWPSQPESAPRMKMMSWDEIESCWNAGMQIESHTHTHPDLRTLSESEIIDECKTADKRITELTGQAPRHFAYPYGHHDARVKTIIGKLYETAVTTKMDEVDIKRHEAPCLPRIDTYYLKSPRLYSAPLGIYARNYLKIRRILRGLRESFE